MNKKYIYFNNKYKVYINIIYYYKLVIDLLINCDNNNLFQFNQCSFKN